MNKITVEHLQRIACVYVRQSTPGRYPAAQENHAGWRGLPGGAEGIVRREIGKE